MPLTQVSTGMIADAAVTPAKLAGGGVELGTRNKIINGDTDEAQLEDADGNLMAPADAKAFVATLP